MKKKMIIWINKPNEATKLEFDVLAVELLTHQPSDYFDYFLIGLPLDEKIEQKELSLSDLHEINQMRTKIIQLISKAADDGKF